MWPLGNQSNAPTGGGEQIGGALTSIVVNGANIASSIGLLIEALRSILPFSGSFGSITWTAAASVTVNDGSVKATSRILFVPTNAAAGTLVGSAKSPYIAPGDYVVGTSFTMKTASAAAAAGGEAFLYILVNV